jgi:hypothetical protein
MVEEANDLAQPTSLERISVKAIIAPSAAGFGNCDQLYPRLHWLNGSLFDYKPSGTACPMQ